MQNLPPFFSNIRLLLYQHIYSIGIIIILFFILLAYYISYVANIDQYYISIITQIVQLAPSERKCERFRSEKNK